MTKKTKQTLMACANSAAGTLPFDEARSKAFVPTFLSLIALGYYLGQGHSAKKAAEKARKLVQECE